MMPSPVHPQLSPPRNFTEAEQLTWADIISIQRPRRERQMHPLFMQGIAKLDMDVDRIPNLEKINRKLKSLTGWTGVLVEGLEDGASFYSMLRDRQFPIGNFIRDRGDLNYTPAPDIVHDLYGHIPFFADADYADFCQRFGALAARAAHIPEHLVQYERVFWFTIEFGLIETINGRRIFGAGIASSIGECEYALSNKPQVVPFDLEVIRRQDFRIDQMQTKLFLLNDTRQLYGCLGELEQAVRRPQ